MIYEIHDLVNYLIFKQFFVVSNYKKQKAQDLPCIFKDLVEKYNRTGLSACEIENLKKWNATGLKVAKQLAFFKPYFSELSILSLENHSLCQTHYNQVVMSNLFYKHLLSYFQENPLDTDMDTQTPSYTDLIAKLDITKTILENVKQENMELCRKTE
ncbi:9409_t:CDS:2 [Gigaspora margarita]|uniref:9409_t:CDS:1 n=1 Tax=Gigaspora margarita TaxID=4874 RepID=A0ABN7VL43_GIGMA|nr:9409_t:CDS:2 [Gigaspora margarita]